MTIPYGIVGAGRLARHIAHYFKLVSLPFITWSRHSPLSAQETLESCDVLLILISDHAIHPWIEKNTWAHSKCLIHCSGALVIPLAQSMHPLMTFTSALYAPETYAQIPFVYETGKPSFKEVFPKLTNPSYPLLPELKPLYHAWCVMSGNFTTLLWQYFKTACTKTLNLPESIGDLYLERICLNLKTHPKDALTGPFQRGDADTMRANYQALQGDPFQKIYQAFRDVVVEEREIIPSAFPAARSAARPALPMLKE